MRQTDLQILEDLIGDNFKPYIDSALKRIRSVYVKSRPTVRRKPPNHEICDWCEGRDRIVNLVGRGAYRYCPMCGRKLS